MGDTTYQQHAKHICKTLGIDAETCRLSGLATYLETYVARAAASAPWPDVEALLKPFEEFLGRHVEDLFTSERAKLFSAIEALRAALTADPLGRLGVALRADTLLCIDWINVTDDTFTVAIGRVGQKNDIAQGTGPTLPLAVADALGKVGA